MVSNDLTKLASVIARHTPADGPHETAVPEVRLGRSSSRSERTGVVYEPSLCIVAQGAKEVILSGEAYRYDPAQSLLVSVGIPVSARVIEASAAQPCLTVRISLDMAVVGELLADGVADSPHGAPIRGIGVTLVEPPLLNAVSRLVSLLDSPRDVGPLAPLILREITYRILTGPQGARLRQIAAAGAPAHRIALAVRCLREQFADSLQVETLAKRVGMSPSAFHLHFKGVTGWSPLQYQKRLRLQEARRLMLGEGLNAGEAAFRVGYESQSQFTREYRRMFGAPPKQDVSVIKVVTAS